MKFTIDLSTGSSRIKLDASNLAGKYPVEKLEPFLLFNGSTYNLIKNAAKEPEGVQHIFRAPNYVLEHLTNEEQFEVVKFFAHANHLIKETLSAYKENPRTLANKSIAAFSAELGLQYLDLAKRLNLVEHFRNYTKSKVTMQDTSIFGTRPQDTRELTFNENEMRETMVISCFCKLASPIFGEIINNLPERSEDGDKKRLPRDKEARCVTLLGAINEEYFQPIIDKLQYYIHHIVESLTAKNKDSAAIFYGLTSNTRTSFIMNSLLVRNFVSCELEKPDSNIIRYTDTMVRTLAQTQDSSANKCQVKTRKTPGSMMSGDDSNNIDQMEVDSIVSIGTMDAPILVKCAIDDVVTSHRRELGVSRADFQRCLDHFKAHPIYQTPLNKFAITSIFGMEIGGGRGIEMITSEPYTKLVAILQLMAYRMRYIQFGNFLTAQKSLQVKMQLTLEEENFKRQATTLSHYRACREQFSKSTVSIGDQVWDKQFGDMLDDMASSIYLINTPDYILDIVPEGETEPIGSMFQNGDVLVPTVDCTEQLCAMIRVFNPDDVRMTYNG